MEKKINIAELLRNCPKGMELDCTCADNVVFDKIIEYDQIKCVIGECHDPLILDKYGRLLHICCPKCVIFPKGKTTWEKFQFPFKDGDIIYNHFIQAFAIFCKQTDKATVSHCFLNAFKELRILHYHSKFLSDWRLATEEEKQVLFDAIREKGYEWNEETKTLEKLPMFKDGDIVFYNNTIAIFKEWGDETLFRSYVIKYLDKTSIIRDAPLFGKSIRKEIRFATEEEKAKLFQAIKENGYKWNEETKTCETLPKFKDGDILANDDDTIFIYNGMEELSPSPSYYVYVIAEKTDLFFAINTSTKKYGTRFATEEEKNILFEAIKNNGYKWYPDTKTLTKLPKFKDGDVITCKNSLCTFISIFKDKPYEKSFRQHCSIILYNNKFIVGNYADYANPRFATEEEKQKLFDAIKENGYRWDDETKTLKNWTIQDAKDGDVIFYDDGWTCIFKRIHGIWFSSYCFITSDGEFHTAYETHAVDSTINGNAHPATKEQRDILFQKIKEAGYKWNPETKTLEKLPKFKVGNRIRSTIVNSGNIYTVLKIEASKYIVKKNNETSNCNIYFDEENNFELVPNKFDISKLKPFDKVLVRDFDNETWEINFFSKLLDGKHFKCLDLTYVQCIPYEGNEHLYDTTNKCDEFFKVWKS